ncbi:ankyrin repeat-containing domain protein [Aspergillus multicolor]|uniref:ankyrin repeat domain-containing protein n=1 Tax=Aspergillus multicolor TaxID=41759 RepID=UPI003CCDB9A0
MKVLISKGAQVENDGNESNDEENDEDDDVVDEYDLIDPWMPAPFDGALISGHIEAMKFLVEEHEVTIYSYLRSLGVKPDLANSVGQTPLFVAAALGHSSIVGELVKLNGKDQGVKWKGSDETPLFPGVLNGHLESVKLLLSRPDLDVNYQNIVDYNMTVLANAAVSGREDIFNLLLTHPKIDTRIQDSTSNDILIHAAMGGNAKIVQKVLGWPGINAIGVGEDGSTALIWAASRGHDPAVKLLLAASVFVNISNEEVHILLKRASSRDSKYTPRERAAAAKDLRVGGYQLNQVMVLNGHNPLDAAARIGSESTVRLLLAHPYISARHDDQEQRTPLINAAIAGHLGAVKLRIAADGETVNSEDRWNESAIVHAAGGGLRAVVEALLECPGIETWDLLAAAAGAGHEEMVKWLIDSGITTGTREMRDALDAAGKAGEGTIRAYLLNQQQLLEAKSA